MQAAKVELEQARLAKRAEETRAIVVDQIKLEHQQANMKDMVRLCSYSLSLRVIGCVLV